MHIEDLLRKLEGLLRHNLEVILYVRTNKVVIQSRTNKCHWTSFEGTNLKDALARAIDKLEIPENDYKDVKGKVWKGRGGTSVYSEEHIKTFKGDEVDGH